MIGLEEIDADQKFARWLYGGSSESFFSSNDVDREIKSLVYACYLAGINTSWSCASHIGQSMPDHINGKAPDGFFVYTPGLLIYNLKADVDRRLDGLVTDLIISNSFLRFERPVNPNGRELIADYFDISHKAKDIWSNRWELNVVPKDLAIARKAKIDSIWNYLAEEVYKFPRVVST